MELLVRTDRDLMLVSDMRGVETVIHAEGLDSPYRRFVIPAVAPWEMVLVVV